MSHQRDTRTELLIQKGIRQAEDDLVILIQSALDQKNTYGKLENSQFRNVVSVAETTDSPEVIKNFLRYQVGRDQKWGRGKDSLAEQIILDIDGKLQTTASNIAQNAKATEFKDIWVELIRRYLGYGARYLMYLNPPKKNHV